MKRLSLYLVCAVLLLAFPLAAKTKLILTVDGNYLQVAKNNYTEQAGQGKLFAEGKIAVTFFQNMYVWAGYGSLPLRDSVTEWSGKGAFEKDIWVDRTVTKRVASAGIGYFVGYLRQSQFAVKLELGVCRIANTIDGSLLDIDTREFIRSRSEKQTGTGYRFSLGGTYGLFRNLFAGVTVGVLYAGKSLDSVRSNLGGLQMAVGLGLRF